MSNGANLPGEIIAEILSRLPVKSLCRFKSVSHSWHALISSDPNFAKTHLTRTNNKHVLISDANSLYSVDYNDTVPSAIKLDFLSDELYDLRIRFGGSCNGLVLAVNDINTKFLLNPSTRKCKKLPESRFNLDLFDGFDHYGLGYDSSTDDYKVVMLCFRISDYNSRGRTIVRVYTLRTHSWRRIQDSPNVHSLCCNLSSGVYFNGCLHWIACRDSDKSTVIAAFDLADENFREVPPPTLVGSSDNMFYKLAVLGGCLCFLAFESSIRTDVWVMEEYGVRESWINFSIYKPEMSRRAVLGLVGDGEVLLAMDGKKLVLYDLKDKTSRDMVVSGIPSSLKARGTYVESLVSLDCENGIGRKCEASAGRL